MKPLKLLTIALIIGLQLFLTGCWNYREVNALAIVAGFAVDKGQQGYKYHLTFELLDFSNSGGQNSTVKPKLLETDGNTIFDAVRNADKKSGKDLFYSHCKVIVISQDLAREGITPLMDWINRDSAPRKTMDLIVSKENTARNILYQKAVTDQIVSYEIDNSLENGFVRLSKVPLVKLYQANDMLYGNGLSLYLPTIKIAASQNENTPELDGTAVFKKDKLLGYLDSDESKYLLFIENKITEGLLLVNQDSKDKNISLEIMNSQTTVTPTITNGKVTINISIKAKAALGEMETYHDYETENGIKAIEASADNELENSIKVLISQVQKQYDSDIFGFGKTVYQNDPNFWKEIKSNWDKIFQSLPVTVSAKVEIQNTAVDQTNGKVRN